MCQFIETIQINNGCICDLNYHTERFNRTRQAFWNGCSKLDLVDYITDFPTTDIIKCRIVYAKDIVEITYSAYSMRKVNSLKLIANDEIDYRYKSIDRNMLNMLFQLKESADDILILKKGYLTDTSIANVALFDGVNWCTPSHPLLKGTKRQALLDKGVLIEKEIHVTKLADYSKICIFNSMINFGDICFIISPQTVVK